MEIGQSFYAVLRKGKFSKTLGGREAAGRKLGPFKITEIAERYVDSEGWRFTFVKWSIRTVFEE